MKKITHLFALTFACVVSASILVFPDGVSPECADDEMLKLGLRYAEAGRADEAIEILNEAIAENPRAGHFMALGVIYLQKGDYDTAYSKLSEALSRDPNLPPARFFMAMLYEKKGMPRDALEEWKKFVAISRKKHFREIAEKHIKQIELQLGINTGR